MLIGQEILRCYELRVIMSVNVNAPYLYSQIQMERDITVFAELIGEEGNCRNVLTGFKKHAIWQSSLFWNSDLEQWLDYWLPTDANCQGVYKCRNGRLLAY